MNLIRKYQRRILLVAMSAFLMGATYALVIDANASVVAEVNEALVYSNKIYVVPRPPWPFYVPRIGDTVTVSFRNATSVYQIEDTTTAGYKQVRLDLAESGGGGGGPGMGCRYL